jgi:glycosyltransferase involved in cell wall biosynthesis
MTAALQEPSPQSLPAVAVSMPAYNAARFLAQAIASVLGQEGVRIELVVVDDGSKDGTADVAAGYADRGVRLLRNHERRGIGHCHNRVLAETSSPLIAHVDADDVIVPGALAKLANAVLSDPRAGQAYCDFYPIDQRGVASPAETERWRLHFARHRAPPIDHARELVVHGMVVSALRTYRRVVFDAVGGFDETLPWAVDYEMALRIAERFTFVHVPEMLYGRRHHGDGATQHLSAKPWRFWRMRWKLVRRQLRAQGGSLSGSGSAATHARLLLGLGHAARAALAPGRKDA